MSRPVADGPALGVLRRTRYGPAFMGATAFFTIFPFLSVLASPPGPVPFALLAIGWALFVVALIPLLRGSPFGRLRDTRLLAALAALITAIAVVVQVGYGVGEATALFFYAGVTAARLIPERWAFIAIAAVGLAAGASAAVANGDAGAGLDVGVTVATISLTLSALSALGRSNRALEAARHELAELAVAEERNRIARDLHDTLGHSLSVIALKSELAGRVLAEEPQRAASELEDVQRVARDALASVRETVSGYRQPSLAIELAGARAALAAAGIEGRVEPAPEGLPRDVDAVLGWAVREGVTNVLRHSDATTARIRVLTDGARHTIEVEDDGRGAAIDEPPAVEGGRPGTGLAGLRERAASLGGRVEAGPLPERGFRLRVTVSTEGAG